jgi:hypothetical protein
MVLITHGWGGLPGLFGAGLIGLLLQELGFSIGVSLVVAGLALALFGWWLNADEPREHQHRLFWLPLQWCGVFLVVVGVASTPLMLLVGIGVVAVAYVGTRYLAAQRTARALDSLTPERLAELEAMGITLEFDDDRDVESLTATPSAPLAPVPRRAVRLRRVDLTGGSGRSDDLDVEVIPMASGTLGVRSTREDESTALAINGARLEVTGVHVAAPDPTRPPRRQCIADGAGVLVLTDQRVIGLITESRTNGSEVSLDRNNTGAVLVFAVGRDDLASVDLTHATFSRRLQLASLYGQITLRVTPTQVLGADERWRFPEAGEVERALETFVDGESTRRAPEDEDEPAGTSPAPEEVSSAEQPRTPERVPSDDLQPMEQTKGVA